MVSSITLGCCSLCGGEVTIPQIWYGVNPPEPTCSVCGATEKTKNLPIIEMVKPKTFSHTYTR